MCFLYDVQLISLEVHFNVNGILMFLEYYVATFSVYKNFCLRTSRDHIVEALFSQGDLGVPCALSCVVNLKCEMCRFSLHRMDFLKDYLVPVVISGD
jgi:hypothetical protein